MDTLPRRTYKNQHRDSHPNKEQVAAIIKLCGKVLQPARDSFGRAIHVTSAFRSPAVNRAVGGVRNSQHMSGEAADITVFTKEENKKLFEIIRDNLSFDQLINERDFSWIHVSYKSKEDNRKQVLKI